MFEKWLNLKIRGEIGNAKKTVLDGYFDFKQFILRSKTSKNGVI